MVNGTFNRKNERLLCLGKIWAMYVKVIGKPYLGNEQHATYHISESYVFINLDKIIKDNYIKDNVYSYRSSSLYNSIGEADYDIGYVDNAIDELYSSIEKYKEKGDWDSRVVFNIGNSKEYILHLFKECPSAVDLDNFKKELYEDYNIIMQTEIKSSSNSKAERFYRNYGISVGDYGYTKYKIADLKFEIKGIKTDK